jgi:hypothetical protein
MLRIPHSVDVWLIEGGEFISLISRSGLHEVFKKVLSFFYLHCIEHSVNHLQ